MLSRSRSGARRETAMNLFSRRANKPALSNKSSFDLIVRLIEPLASAGLSQIERLDVLKLSQEGALPLELLAERVATDLYHEELRNGAWVVDIGFFGNRLFVPDVIKEIQQRNGSLWKIEEGKPL